MSIRFKAIDQFSASSLIKKVSANEDDYDKARIARDTILGQRFIPWLRQNRGSYAIRYEEREGNMSGGYFDYTEIVTSIKVYDILEEVNDGEESD